MKNGYRTWHEVEVDYYCRHPDEIPQYLDVAFAEASKDGEWAAFLQSVRAVVEARGGIAELAARLGRSRTSLYKTLSRQGNPRLDSLGGILRELGCRLAVQPVVAPKRAPRRVAGNRAATAVRRVRAPRVRPADV